MNAPSQIALEWVKGKFPDEYRYAVDKSEEIAQTQAHKAVYYALFNHLLADCEARGLNTEEQGEELYGEGGKLLECSKQFHTFEKDRFGVGQSLRIFEPLEEKTRALEAYGNVDDKQKIFMGKLKLQLECNKMQKAAMIADLDGMEQPGWWPVELSELFEPLRQQTFDEEWAKFTHTQTEEERLDAKQRSNTFMDAINRAAITGEQPETTALLKKMGLLPKGDGRGV